VRFDWEEFKEGDVRSTKDRIHVTLSTDRKFYFNRHALAALGNPDGVTLMYDRRRSVIGIKASPLNRTNSFLLRPKQKSCEGRMITAANFCRNYRIRPKETIAFTTARLDPEGILVLDLNAVRVATKSPKRSAK
jgi:hypothetical protein